MADTTTTTLSADAPPNGITDYLNFNLSQEDGSLVSQVKRSGKDMVDSALDVVGLKEEKEKPDDPARVQSSVTKAFASVEPANVDIRAVRQTFRKGGVEGADVSATTPRSSAYLMSNGDFLYCDSGDMSVTADFSARPLIQNIILNEFQPFDQIFLGQTLDKVFGGIINIASVVGVAAGNAGGRAIMRNAMINHIAKNPMEFYSGGAYDSLGTYTNAAMDKESKEAEVNMFNWSTDPMKQIMRLFNSGRWLNTYELPFYGAEYLTSGKGGAWTQEGAKKSLTQGGATALEGFGIYFPTTPNWSIDVANCAREGMTVEFYLINKDEDWMLRNFKFLHALFAGTQFVTMRHSVVQSPNVYNVVIPGRFEIMWASMSANVTSEGKLRKCSYMHEMLNTIAIDKTGARLGVTADESSNTYADPSTQGKTKNSTVAKKETVAINPDASTYAGFKSINENTLWPDAWKVTLQIQDLTMNNFNTYLNYHAFGASAARLRANTTESDSLESAIKAAANMLNDLTDGKYADKIKKGADKVLNAKEKMEDIGTGKQGILDKTPGKPPVANLWPSN